MKFHKKFFNIVFAFSLFFLFSCKKFVEVPLPKKELAPNIVFADSAGATAAILGIYIDMMQSLSMTISNGGVTYYSGLSADEIYPTASGNFDLSQFYNNAVSKDNSINGGLMWGHAYKLIYDANMCIESLNLSNELSASVKNKLMAEAKFVRAFIYFNLTNLYGDVPLVISTDYQINKVLPRTSVNIVYDHIISDLNDAQNLFQNVYSSTSRLRPDVNTVKALLAKVYLFRKEWFMAEKISSELIASGIYSLEVDLNNVFLSNSKETIWALEPVLPNFETLEGANIIPTTPSRLPAYVISSSLLNSFETDDKRNVDGNWIKSNLISGQSYTYPFKYKQRRRFNPLPATPSEYYTVFRLAEQFLIRAEAKAQQNNVNGALSDLNIIRNRSGLLNLPDTLDQSQILAAVEQERRVELFCEWGNRWFDLKRNNRANITLNNVKQDWQETDTLYPIPQNEINKNPSLKQNSGY